jgi:hypothetical protein
VIPLTYIIAICNCIDLVALQSGVDIFVDFDLDLDVMEAHNRIETDKCSCLGVGRERSFVDEIIASVIDVEEIGDLAGHGYEVSLKVVGMKQARQVK